MRILLATDGSSSSDRATQLVASTPWPDGTVIQVVHVGEPITDPFLAMPGVLVDPETIDRLIAAGRQRNQELLATTAARLAAPGRTVETKLVEGRTATTIAEAAQTFGADVLVLGSHGRGALGSAILGSVAAEVVEYATMPVLIARTPSISRLVLADDGSASAAAARELVARMPGFAGMPVDVVSVSERQPSWFGWLEPVGADDVQAFEASIQADRQRHEGLASTSAAQLTAAGLHAEPDAPTGDPGTEIVRSARDFQADLIVMGTRGQTGLERLLLGSVARKVLHHAPCSVLVIRQAPGARPTH